MDVDSPRNPASDAGCHTQEQCLDLLGGRGSQRDERWLVLNGEGPVSDHRVEMDVEFEGGAKALHEGDCPDAGGTEPCAAGSTSVKPLERAQPAITAWAVSPRIAERSIQLRAGPGGDRE